MDILMLINVIFTGLIFVAWSKTGMLNFTIKTLMLVLFVFNVLRMVGKV